MTGVRDMKGGKKWPPLAWPVIGPSLLIELFSLLFFTALSFVCASQTRHYPSAICIFSPPLLASDWFDAIWKGLQSGGSLVPFLSRMVASIQLPPSPSLFSPVCCVSCFSLHTHGFIIRLFFALPFALAAICVRSISASDEPLPTPHGLVGNILGSATRDLKIVAETCRYQCFDFFLS